MIAATRSGRLSSPWMIRFAFVGLGLASALIGVATFEVWQDANRWDPLGNYPVQTLLTADGTTPIGEPTYYLDDDITVRGVKCVDSDAPVQVSGVMSWTSIEPPGSIIEVGRGVATRDPGCTQATYSNPIPPAVMGRIAALVADGVEQSTWRISGVETPQRDGETGEQRAWSTPTFTIIHQVRGAGDAG